ncbi:MAG: ParB N-terminal domain-containing protein [Alphaproteobacteria bacterium]|nr:ParB N-terminal domain-containing protein [Alphaproteobacteria bacterium]
MASWTLSEIPPDVSALAEESARRDGVPLGDWLARAIERQRDADGASPAGTVSTPTEELMARIQAAMTATTAEPDDSPPAPVSALVFRFLPAPHPAPRQIAVENLGFGQFQHETGLAQGLEAVTPEAAEMLTPVIARPSPDGDGRFELVTGLARWKHAQASGRDELPVLVMELSDQDVIKLTLIEMLMSNCLAPVAAAESCRWLLRRGGLGEDDLMEIAGLNRQEVRDRIALLALPGPVLERVESGTLDIDRALTMIGAVYAEPVSRMIAAHDLPLERVRAVVDATNRITPGTGAGIDAAAAELGRLFDAEVTVTRHIDETAVTVTVTPVGGGAVSYRLQSAGADSPSFH